MSDRHNGYIVTLEKSVKDEDSKKTIEAILMLKGVIKVEPVVEDISSMFARNQVHREMFQKIIDLFKD